MRTWSSSARGAGPRASSRVRESALELVGSHGRRLRRARTRRIYGRVTGLPRPVNNDPMDEDALISEQKAYYRAVAPEYGVTFTAPGNTLAPYNKAIEIGLDRFRPAGRILEIASGNGAWTVHLLRHASSVTALDSSPEMHELARTRTGADPRVRYVLADVFSWQPDGRYDVVFFANWLSHVPPGRFHRFWETLGAALDPAGRVFFVDELADAWRYEDLFSEDFVDDPSVPVVRRALPDGRTFRVVKVFWEPDDLRARLSDLGWRAEIHTAGPFFWGDAVPTD
jgi:2-polyprenyl-3-methyl-5-hydroxy-6-metoxy-1,4-benzoquinol methylase